MFTLQDIFDVAIKLETNGERLYREAARSALDPELASLLDHLADEEAKHETWFKERLKSLPGADLNADSALARMGRSMLRNVVGEQCLSLDNVDFGAMESVIELLDAAFDLENDTVDFYEMIASFVESPDAIEHLNEIIRTEMDHARALAEYVKKTQGAEAVTA